MLKPGTRIHLVGIGGFGLSAIARVLHGRGYPVSGSDRQHSALTEALAAEGIAVSIGHDAENITGLLKGEGQQPLLVLASSAIPDDNIELAEARRLGIPIVRRRQILGALTGDWTTIAVAGTHGKTTTAAMIAWTLLQAGLDPTFVVGGTIQNLGTNARAGSGPHFVIEADEYDHAFLGLRPGIAVVTTLEHDHPDCFPAFDDMKEAFAAFTQRIVPGGRLVVCNDDPEARRLGARFAGNRGQRDGAPAAQHTVTYGLGRECEWQARDVRLQGSPTFKVLHRNRCLGTCALQLPGDHNVLNALAALAVTSELGVEFGIASAALTRFQGTARRFELKGQALGITVVDDYAHHPTEIRATLAAARTRYPGQTIWAVFQPHTYSRTATLMDEFATAFGEADHILVTRIFAARERNRNGVRAQDLVERIRAQKQASARGPSDHQVLCTETLDGAVEFLFDHVRPGGLVLTLGAGDGYLIGERLLDRLRQAADWQGPNSGNAQRPVGAGLSTEFSIQDGW